MERFLEYVVSQLISFPEDLIILKESDARRVVFKLKMRQSDIGKVVGKHGQTIAALRNLLSAAASRNGEKAFLEILEDQGERR